GALKRRGARAPVLCRSPRARSAAPSERARASGPFLNGLATSGARGSRCEAASVADEQQAAAGLAAPSPDDAHLGSSWDLALAAFAPHLDGCFVEEAVAVEAPRRELSAVRVEGLRP